MRFIATLKVLGILLMIFSLFMFPPIAVGIWYQDGGIPAFIIGFGVTFLTGLLLWLFFRKHQHILRTRDGFLVVVLFWFVLSVFGSIPFDVSLYPKMSITDAIFESVSGLTTTGATVLTHLQALPHSILYYRQQLHLLGGIGIIVLAVAILPMLGVGGMQLYRAEIAGPLKTTKLTPRITQTAKALWTIYFGLAIICTVSFWLAGMPLFDAVSESFSAISTGGFSIHDSSLAYYHSTAIDIIAIIFMMLGAINFSLHFAFLKQKRLSLYYKDPEFLAYLKILGCGLLIVLITLLIYHYYHFGQTVLNSIFTIVSMSTTTGLTTTNFSIWPTFLPFLIIFLAIIGGCAGSTTGGLKIIRCLLLKNQGKRELNRLIHPKAIWAIKLGDEPVPEDLMQAIWGFVAFFVALYIILLLILLAMGLDFTTAFGAASSCISNTGASIGKVASNYKSIGVAAKWVLVAAMLVGRLEIFTILVILMPSYWRS